jgi:hypothetical protein
MNHPATSGGEFNQNGALTRLHIKHRANAPDKHHEHRNKLFIEIDL